MRLEFLLQDGAHTLGILLLVPFDLGAAEEGFELGVYVSNMLVGHFMCRAVSSTLQILAQIILISQ